MVSMLASSAVDRGFEPRSGQTKDYKISVFKLNNNHSLTCSPFTDMSWRWRSEGTPLRWSYVPSNLNVDWESVTKLLCMLRTIWIGWKMSWAHLHLYHNIMYSWNRSLASDPYLGFLHISRGGASEGSCFNQERIQMPRFLCLKKVSN